MENLVWVIPALPLAGFVLLLLFGNRLREPAAQSVAEPVNSNVIDRFDRALFRSGHWRIQQFVSCPKHGAANYRLHRSRRCDQRKRTGECGNDCRDAYSRRQCGNRATEAIAVQ